MSRFIFAGDSFAEKAFTHDNCDRISRTTDICLADHWNIPYIKCVDPGYGNLNVLDKILALDLNLPVIWVYTEPGRDYGRITGRSEFEWMQREDIWQVRRALDREIFSRIKKTLRAPVAFIGGLSDVDQSLAHENGFTVLHPSWQRWISERLESQWFEFGWGALDIGWRAHYDHVVPSRTAAIAWDQQIKEWCWWEEKGYFYKEHPTPLANKEFARDLNDTVINWLDSICTA